MDCDNCQVEQRAHISLTAEITSFDQLKEWVLSVANRASVPVKTLRKMLVALDEIFTNISRYAYPAQKGTVSVCARYDDDTTTISFTFCDTGIPFNPLNHEEPNVNASLEEREEGGLGIYLVKQLMDGVEYRRENGCNRLMLFKHLASCNS